MSTLFVSDLHLKGPGHPPHDAFLRMLARESFDELVLVGDVVDLWLVPDGVVPTQMVPLVAELHRLTTSGVAVTWVPGNHDRSPALDELGIDVRPRWEKQVGNRRVVAVHGDSPRGDGMANLLVDRLLRRRLTRRLAGFLGPRRVWRTGEAISAFKRARYTASGLQEALLRQNQLADQLLKQADVVVLGHTHAPGRLKRPAGHLFNLGDWFQHRTLARCTADRIELLFDDGVALRALPDGPPQRRPALLRAVATESQPGAREA